MAFEVWVSDKDSFFRHRAMCLQSWKTKCGIVLSGSRHHEWEELRELAEGKPRCSACLEGVRV
ncbi:hypothetical protein [Streptomyces sp. S1]|uniref:hypothetical protein n=1 Tax=Streptomyces sp. S1 TaxID=718288 RepID=UPI003D72DAE4